MLLRGGLVIYGEGFEPVRADVLIEGDRIVRVARGISAEADEVIDASGRVIIPGLINAHTHSPMTLLRGLADDLPLMEWLQNYIWPAERKLGRREVYWGALLGLIEMAKSGTTTFVDMYFHMDAVAEAVMKVGLRAFLGYGMVDLGNEEKRKAEIRETERFMKFIEELGDRRINFILAPHAPYTCSPECLRWVAERAREGILVTIHLAETREEVKEIKERYGMTPVQLLDSLGLLTPGTIAAHGVWLDERDAKILATREVTIVHCPASNMKLASGVMPLKMLLKAGVNVALGTDGAASNNNLDMLEEMKLVALLHKVHTLDPTVADAKMVLRMATVHGARALGLKAGIIKEGYLADLAVIDFRRPHLRPLNDPVSHLVYSARGGDVEDLIVAGKIVMLDGEVLGVDEEKVLDKVENIREVVI
ncbi:amidohydrolase family protein [Pyrococcus yayanosii]|uniref:amidohydrolase family protein n=1 Tax=Pyrococcus yayanosii TaxID=1008460 RepID=UPI00064E86E3|nr:amidohydrolase family protein [Pyrococcus yayanosii]